MFNKNIISIKSEARFLVVIPFRLYDLSLRLENINIDNIIGDAERYTELENLKSKFEDCMEKSKELSFRILKGKHIYFPEPIGLKKHFLVSNIVKNKNDKKYYELYIESEQVIYFDYGYGCLIVNAKYSTEKINDFIYNINDLREILIQIKESNKFYTQKLIIKTANHIDHNNTNPFTYGFSITTLLDEQKTTDKINNPPIDLLNISEDKLFEISKIFCQEGIIFKDIKQFRVSNVSGLSYINHGFTGSFVITNKPTDSQEVKIIEGIHNYLYLITCIIIDLTDLVHNERKNIFNIISITKNNKDSTKKILNKLKLIRDLSDIVLFEAQPAIVCGTETEYSIYGKTWKLGDFNEYTDILKNQSEYLSRNISELDKKIKDYQNEKTNSFLFGISTFNIFSTSVALITFAGGQTDFLELNSIWIKCGSLVGLSLSLWLLLIVHSRKK